jgi:Tol biopolymer transport system component
VPLGAGGMGEVYRARDTRLGREVALKVLPEAVAEDRSRLARFEQEARAASALNHPNIVTIHDIGRGGETAYIAMELVEGKTLRELAAGGPLPVRRVLGVAAQIAEGLAKAHSAGIVHRDLKPENLMVSKDGFVKILDFGLAKLVEPQSGELSAMPTLAHPETHPGTVLGTVAYMSPEQASGEALDFRSDQFSLGAILYEMATGQKAFQKKTAAETMSAIIREEPEPVAKLRPELPLPVRWMLDRCLAKDRDERYASTRDLARDLASVRDHISEVSGGSGAALASTVRPRRRIARLVAGAVLAASLILAGWFARGRGTTSPAPRFTRLTFRQGSIGNARFAPDGQTVVYGATWAGDPPGRQLYRAQVGSPESAKFDFVGDILAISPSNEMAVLLNAPRAIGTLARVPMSGGTPREVLEAVQYAGADFSPDGKELAVVHMAEGRLEYPVGKVLVARGAYAPRISPDGRFIAYWQEDDEGREAVAVVDREGRTRRVLSEGWLEFEGAPCWGSNGEIWFTAPEKAGNPAVLWAVDRSGNRRLLTRVPGGLELEDRSRDGRALVNYYTHAQLVRFASVENPTERELSWLDASQLAQLSSDGKSILLNEAGEGSGSGPVIYLRGTDGSPAVKLGEGVGFALSPDGKWVLATHPPGSGTAVDLFLLPTGPGRQRVLAGGGFIGYTWGAWLPDGRSVLYSAVAKSGNTRLYVQAVPDGKPQPIGPDPLIVVPWMSPSPVSPNGKYAIGTRNQAGEVFLVPLDGKGAAKLLAGLSVQADRVVQWTADSRSLYVYRPAEHPLTLELFDVETGHRRPWKRILLDDSIEAIRIRVTPDGRAWAFGGARDSSALYLVEGLH